jgi:hypothetical protein
VISTISHIRRFFGGCGGWPYGVCIYGPEGPGIYSRGGPGIYGPGAPGMVDGVVIGGSRCGEAGPRCSLAGILLDWLVKGVVYPQRLRLSDPSWPIPSQRAMCARCEVTVGTL